MSDILSFGDWVRKRRKALDLTQDDLARRVGCSKELIAKIEGDARRPSKEVATLLAGALQIDPVDHVAFVRAARADLAPDRLPVPTQGVPRPAFVAAPAPPPPSYAAVAVQQQPLPSGTVTFLFSDIVGSTRLWEQHPEAMAAALAQHHALLREAIEAHAGQVFQIIGDAFCAAFPTAPDALRAALASQRALHTATWGPTGPIRVRMALHTAAVAVEAGNYPSGPHFNRLARLLSAGHGGQVLLSQVTGTLVREQLPPDVALRDLGAHRLRDLSLPEQIFQLAASDLATDFPALRTLDARPGYLPAPATTLIGRERELADLARLLRVPGARLVTLTGPGGTGKTRLALQVAADLADAYPDGTWFVDLASLSDPTLVAATVAYTLGAPENAERPAAETVVAFLRARELLLVLDNYEQVLAATDLVAAIIVGAPRVTVLATSRVPLQLYGEREVAVAPLALPTLGMTGVEHVSQYDAVKLFVERAQAARMGFCVTDANAPIVAEICVRLDGLPLAIELVAARMKLFAPEALLAKLAAGGSLPLLISGARNLPARQQTIRNTIAWSYDLLSDVEQVLFARLGVFVGGFILDAAEAVTGDPETRSQGAIAGLLEHLVAHSLVQVTEGADGEPRFAMLETIREFALERLRERGEEEASRRQHAAWITALSTTLVDQLWGATQVEALTSLQAEYDNILAALNWMLTVDQTGAAQMTARLGWYWYWTKHRREGIACATRVIAQHPEAGELRGDLLRLLALLAYDSAPQRAREWMKESLAIARQIGNAAQIAETLLVFAQIEITGGGDNDAGHDYRREALALYEDSSDRLGIARALVLEFSPEAWEQSLGMFRQIGHLRGIADVLTHLARNLHRHGAPGRAWELLLEARQNYQELGDIGGEVWVLLGLGDIAQSTTRLVDAADYYNRAQELAQLSFDLNGKAWAEHNLGEVLARRQETLEAVRLFRGAINHFRRSQYPFGLVMSLADAAYIAWSAGDYDQGVRFLAALDNDCRTVAGVPFEQDVAPEHAIFFRFVHDRLQETLDTSAFEHAWFEGIRLSFEEALAEAQHLAEC